MSEVTIACSAALAGANVTSSSIRAFGKLLFYMLEAGICVCFVQFSGPEQPQTKLAAAPLGAGRFPLISVALSPPAGAEEQRHLRERQVRSAAKLLDRPQFCGSGAATQRYTLLPLCLSSL